LARPAAGRGSTRRTVPGPGGEVPLILLDTDVVLDLALGREPWVEDAAALFARLETGPKRSFVAWHTISNAYYLLAGDGGDRRVRDFLVELTRIAAVVPTSSEDVRFAASLPLNDFEDALQVAAAVAAGAEVIVTRNVADFEHAPVPVRTPAQLVREL
jgi:predicted nucleic acid-binding protein